MPVLQTLTAQQVDDVREIADRLAQSLQCNCDLDNWEPERTTGHSWVCRIHKSAVAEAERQKQKRRSRPGPPELRYLERR